MHNKIFKLIFTIAISLCTNALFSQNQLVVQPGPTQGKDALLHGLASQTSVNYGSSNQLAAVAASFSSVDGVVRAIFEFDISSIPDSATIISASLSLYSIDASAGLGQHTTNGLNQAWLQNVTSPWDESTVTWNTMPSVDTSGQILLDSSTSTEQDYLDIDVTDFIEKEFLAPTMNHGFMLSLQTEMKYRVMNFKSSDHADANERPILVVDYSLPDYTGIKKRKNNDIVSVYPNPTKEWVFIEFDEIQNNIVVEILSETGQKLDLINYSNSAKVEIPLPPKKGIYILKILGDNRSYSRKIVAN